MNKPGHAPVHAPGHLDGPNGPGSYKRDSDGKFAKVNTLVKKIALAKAQGVKHVEPGPSKKVPPAWSAIKGTNAKADGLKIYQRKKAGEFKDDHEIYLACKKLVAAYKKKHPNDQNPATANAIHNAYKRHEYDETGQVHLLGEVKGKLDTNGNGAQQIPPAKPSVDTSPSGISMVSSDKFDKPTALKATGQTLGGVTGAKVYVDGKGQEWVVKSPKGGSNAYSNKSFMVDVEIAASRIQNKAGLNVPAMHKEEVDGKISAVSKMYKAPGGGPVHEAFPKGVGLDITTMSDQDLLDLQRNQVFDWLISNHDSHSANFLRTSDGIVGIDKGQAFKFFGKDKLDYNYTPVSPLDGNVSVYQRIWKQYAQGYGELFDPSEGELHVTIQRIQNIPDAEYKKLLRPYAEQAAASGSLSAPGNTKAEKVENFLKAAVERKNNLQKDFDAYYAKVTQEHNKANAASSKPVAKKAAAKPAVMGPVATAKAKAGANTSIADLKNSKKFYPVGLPFSDLNVGDFVVDEGSSPHEYFEVTEVYKNGALFTSMQDDGVDFEMYPEDWNGGDWKYLDPTPNTNGGNKVDKTPGTVINDIDSFVAGDKFESGWGATYTVTDVGTNPSGEKYISTVDEQGDFAGNFYTNTFKNATPPSQYVWAGNLKSQGALEAKDLAGQKLTSILDAMPGDKLIYNAGGKANNDVEVEVTAKAGPGYIYVKKTATNALMKITDEHIKDGKVKFAYTNSQNTSARSGFTPLVGDHKFSIGDIVLITTDTGDGESATIVEVNKGSVVVDTNGELYEYTAVKGYPDNQLHWVDNPQSFLDGEVGLYSELGLPSEQGGSPKPKGGKVKLQGELAKDINSVAVGDVIVHQGDGEAYKVTKAQSNGVEAISLKDGASGLFTPSDFENGYVEWGKQDAQSSSAPSTSKWPDYPGSDIKTGPFNAQNAPGTTLSKLSLPGWGAYIGDLHAGDKVVGFDVNGEFRKGTVTNVSGKANVYVSWDDDPNGDWVEFTKLSTNGLWGDGAIGSTDTHTLVGKIQNNVIPAPDPSASKVKGSNKIKIQGEQASFDSVAVGDIITYNALGSSTAIEVTSVGDGPSGNKITGNIVATDGQLLPGTTLAVSKMDFSKGQIEWGKPAGLGGAKSTPLPPPAAATPSKPQANAGKPATFDALSVGDVYHVPNGKIQKVISKDADSFTAQSVSGNQHTYPKEKFNNWAATHGVLLGYPAGQGVSDPAPDTADLSKGDMLLLPKDMFDQNSTSTKCVVTSVTSTSIKYKYVGSDEEHTIKKSDWADTAKGWKKLAGQSDWEKYSLGLITWEEYQQSTDAQHTAKLHAPEGPAAPGGVSPAQKFASAKEAAGVKVGKVVGNKVVESKSPPKWADIKGTDVKELGQIIYDMKKNGEFTSDVPDLWKACGKVLRDWKKKHPNDPNPPSQNQVRNAARRLEFDETGAVMWETEAQKTAQVVGNIQTSKSSINHVPIVMRTNKTDKMPLTAFGDVSKPAGSYQNPHNFGVTYDVTPEMVEYGVAITPQKNHGFSSSQLSSIKKYTYGGYSSINAHLRSGSLQMGSSASLDSHVKNIDAAIAKSSPLQDWTIVTRGVGGGYDFGIPHHNYTLDDVRAQIGKTLENKGYSSTSFGSKPAFGGKARVIYRLPPGLKAMYVAGDKNYNKLSSCGSHERELILPRNLKLKIISADTHTDGMGYSYDVVVEVVGVG